MSKNDAYELHSRDDLPKDEKCRPVDDEERLWRSWDIEEDSGHHGPAIGSCQITDTDGGRN
jgi:hypothetical protein